MSNAEYLTKINAEIHINELSEISKRTNEDNVPDTKNHRFAKNGFSYRTAYFQDYDGEYYKITITVGQNGNVSTVYNVGKIKKIHCQTVILKPFHVAQRPTVYLLTSLYHKGHSLSRTVYARKTKTIPTISSELPTDTSATWDGYLRVYPRLFI